MGNAQPNAQCNEKTFEGRHKKIMIERVINQSPERSPTHDLKHALCKSCNQAMLQQAFTNMLKYEK
jgi:hypothetical protein